MLNHIYSMFPTVQWCTRVKIKIGYKHNKLENNW